MKFETQKKTQKEEKNMILAFVLYDLILYVKF